MATAGHFILMFNLQSNIPIKCVNKYIRPWAGGRAVGCVILVTSRVSENQPCHPTVNGAELGCRFYHLPSFYTR
jgi:hypothetical protein